MNLDFLHELALAISMSSSTKISSFVPTFVHKIGLWGYHGPQKTNSTFKCLYINISGLNTRHRVLIYLKFASNPTKMNFLQEISRYHSMQSKFNPIRRAHYGHMSDKFQCILPYSTSSQVFRRVFRSS